MQTKLQYFGDAEFLLSLDILPRLCSGFHMRLQKILLNIVQDFAVATQENSTFRTRSASDNPYEQQGTQNCYTPVKRSHKIFHCPISIIESYETIFIKSSFIQTSAYCLFNPLSGNYWIFQKQAKKTPNHIIRQVCNLTQNRITLIEFRAGT